MFYHGVHGEHGGKTLSQRMFAAQTHTFADSCITFMSFMHFMVKQAVLCVILSPWTAVPLDHARRAAGGELRETRTVPPDFCQCEGLGVDSRKQTDAVLAYCKAKLTRKICPNGAVARKSGSPLHPSSETFLENKKMTNSSMKIHEKEQIQLHHEEHEGSEVKPGSAGRLTGFVHFW